MNWRRILLAAVLAIASLNVAQIAIPQITDNWYVVKDATDLNYKFEFVCVGNRTTAQDVTAGLRILDHDGSIHILPERAFRAQQEAGLIGSAVEELSCAGGPQAIKK